MRKSGFFLLLFLSQILFLGAQEKSASSTYLSGYLVDEVYNLARMKYNGTWGASFYINTNIASDDAFPGGGGFDDRPEFQMAENFTFDPNVSSSIEIWNVNVAGIEGCNFLINSAKNSTENEDRIIAEAKFLRAFFYFNFVRIFGDVPIFNEGCIPLLNKTKRAPVSEVYAFIIDDLISSIDYLPTKSELQNNEIFRATKGAAKTLLGKVYLYNEQWNESLTVLKEVINSGDYALEAEYSNIWREDNEHGIESIFELEYTAQEMWDWMSNKNTANIDIQLMGIRGLWDSDTYNSGWGFCNATHNLVEAYAEADDEIRREATIIFADSLTAHGCSFEDAPGMSGYWNKKYAAKSEFNEMQKFDGYGQNEIQLRYADVLLMAAEASSQLGNDTDAKTYVNIVRERAKLPALNSTGNQLLNDIYKERRLELAFESNRFFDLQRWGLIAEVLGPLDFNIATNGLWPIPQSVIDYNPDIYQNPSYTNNPVVDFTGKMMDRMASDPASGNSYALYPQMREPQKKVISVDNYKYNICLDDSVLQSKGIYTLDENSRRTDFFSRGYNKYNDDFDDSYKTRFTYDENGNLKSQNSQTFNYKESNKVPYGWISAGWNQEFEYDENGYMVNVTSAIGVNLMQKDEYKWDNNYQGYETSTYNYNSRDSVWILFWISKYENTFENNKLTKSIIYQKTSETDEFELTRKREIIYLSDNNVIETSQYNTNDGTNFELTSREKQVYVFDSENNIASITNYTFNIELNTYTEPSNKTEYFRDYSNKTELVKTYTYNALSEGFIQNDVALFYTYASWHPVSIDEEILTPAKNSFTIFPNPTKENLNIKTNDNLQTSAKLYNLDGKLLGSYSFTNSITINTSELEAQIYILKIENDNHTETKKIIIR